MAATITAPDGVIVQQAVGLPRTLGTEGAADPMDRRWTTGFFKEPVADRRWLGRTNLSGDGQADRRVHGGPDKAVLIYAATHYPWWRDELAMPDLPFGAFGENWTVEHQDEVSVCLGDVYAVGSAVVQVSQPRQPCWKLSRRWRIPDLAARAQASGRLGWYVRVLREGAVRAGDRLRLVERPLPDWPIDRLNRVMHRQRDDLDAAAFLARCELLAPSWRQTFQRRLDRLPPPDERARLHGKT